MIIYTLTLEEGKYYVGKTDDLMKRIGDHKDGIGSEWTKKYKIVSLLENFNGDKYDEDKTVLKYMEMYGIDNVRGGIYSNIILTFDQRITILKSIRGANDLCLRCGKNTHYIGQCNEVICYRCGRNDHLTLNCGFKDHVYGGNLNGCYRCGRMDHWAIRCNRSKDVYGKSLDSNCVIS